MNKLTNKKLSFDDFKQKQEDDKEYVRLKIQEKVYSGMSIYDAQKKIYDLLYSGF